MAVEIRGDRRLYPLTSHLLTYLAPDGTNLGQYHAMDPKQKTADALLDAGESGFVSDQQTYLERRATMTFGPARSGPQLQ